MLLHLQGYPPTEQRVNYIMQVPMLMTQSELKIVFRFNDLQCQIYSYCSLSLPQMISVTMLLIMTVKCQDPFEKVKEIVSQSLALMHHDVNECIKLYCMLAQMDWGFV